MPIEAHLVGYQHDQNHGDGHGYGKSKNIDERKKTIASEVAQGGLQVMEEHADVLGIEGESNIVPCSEY
jgi:hypothetical protein